jgi:glycerol uptake facilitator-like aquaporin
MSEVKPAAAPLTRRLVAEGLGTALLTAVVVGSGIAAMELSPNDIGLQLLENSIATALGLAVLILIFGPVSGAHFNPVVSVVDWLLTRRTGSGLSGSEVLAHAATQTVGGIAGAVLANVMFDLPAVQVSAKERLSVGHGIAEVVATAGLVLLIFALARTGRAALSAAAVGAYIGSAYWFTSSTSFANPAVTIGRIFSDTFAGIAPVSALLFIGSQIVGGLLGLAAVRYLFPDAAATAAHAVVPHAARSVPERS